MSSQPLPLLCLPFAGAGAGFYRPWQQQAPAGLQPVPLQLPGREELVAEEPHREVAAAVRALLPEAVAAVRGHHRVAVFGHSLGAALAFELTRALEERTEIEVVELFVSGSPAPHLGRSGHSADLDDDAFLAQVEVLAGYRHPAFDSAEFRELMLPGLRADVAMHEAYRPLAAGPVEAPVTCLLADQDTLVDEQDARAWESATTGGFRYVTMPGGHMYLTTEAGRILDLIADVCAGPAAVGREA
ncbi:thioesterase [Kitasatospora sp. MMS16-BH015]|uniref:thioesterase II family protein n=1 Tax=Kitasatospora sp. MMS16-BH015 TaxID=2018025 RepID=UPI000CA38351|nr:alpha/beta fold hydrolase [Kitasatospora sp. MMS16-BH015]AUG77449.1 thioesterase [Kitasatospora sp. MMS16-BH015]